VSLAVRTERLDDARPLLELLTTLPDEGRIAFIREGEGIVGAGTAAVVPVPLGAGRLAAARAALDAHARGATVDDAIGLPGTGLVAVGSFTFDDTDRAVSASVLRIPRIVIGRRDGVTWRTTIGGGADRHTVAAGGEDPAAPVDGPDSAPHGTSDRPRYAGSTLDDATWLEAVDQVVGGIRDRRVEKAVLARDVHLWSRTPFRTEDVLVRLAARFPSCFTFLVDGLVGASPELLLRRDGTEVRSRVLAGTVRRGADTAEDARLGADLLASAKDLWEHELATRSVTEVLRRSCSRLDASDAPSLVRLDNVQHLGSDVSGTLAAPTHVLDLVEALHPTAAVAGTPREDALALIREVEGMDRGRYAGPVGWCDAVGDGEFAIALRCGELDGSRARLFAGAGIVADSLPEAELMETWLKLRAMTDVLTRR